MWTGLSVIAPVLGAYLAHALCCHSIFCTNLRVQSTAGLHCAVGMSSAITRRGVELSSVHL